jgi:hypothetical protein
VKEDSKDNLPDYSLTLTEVQMRLFWMAIPKLQGLQFLNCSGGYIEKPGVSSWILEWDLEVTGMSDTSSGREAMATTRFHVLDSTGALLSSV